MERPHFDTLSWEEQLATSIGLVDKHRQKLINIYNLMIERYNARVCKDNITEPFFKLAFVAESFFFDLELLMRQFNYPKFGDKKRSFEEVLQRIVVFKDDFAAQKETVCRDMLFYLSTWMQNEIMHFDEHLVSFLRNKGVV